MAQDTYQGKSWSARFESIASLLISEIPEAAPIIDALFAAFWPDGSEADKPEIFDQIKGKVQKMIDEAVLEQVIQDRTHDLKTVHGYLSSSVNDEDPGDRLQALGHLVTWTGYLGDHLPTLDTQPEQAFQTIPLWVAAAHLNLGALRTTYRHVNSTGTKAQIDDARTALETAFKGYEAFFNGLFEQDQWKQWREGQISATYSIVDNHQGPYNPVIAYTATFTLSDSVSNEKWSIVGGSNVEDELTKFCVTLKQRVTQRIMSEATAQLAGILEGTYTLRRYLPGYETSEPVVPMGLDYFTMGPYSPAIVGVPGSFDSELSLTEQDTPGVLEAVNIRAGDSVDGLQFVYDSGAGNWSGNATGGNPVTVDIPAGGVGVGLEVWFHPEIIYKVLVNHSDSDGKIVPSAPYGNARGWTGGHADITSFSSHQMIGSEHSNGPGPDGITGTSALALTFAHRSLVGGKNPGYPGLWWPQVSGGLRANKDLAVGAGGQLWALDASGKIYAHAGEQWYMPDGTADQIAVDVTGIPWVINTAGGIQYRSSANPAELWHNWVSVPGWSGTAISLATGGDGSVWVVDDQHAVHRYSQGAWATIETPALDGAPRTVSVGVEGLPWIITDKQAMYSRVGDAGAGGSWVQQPGWAVDIAVASTEHEMVWSLGADGRIWHMRNGAWYQTAGSASQIAVDPEGSPYVMQPSGLVFSRGAVT